ncbi:DUF418 domain-containing protein [Corynebacterium comes]|uniref:DUF418 domain-containing protein n=1 Tax=Corynebacterium comes TaxID=2675218 RepID=A0A6B8VXA4_9CORY|nr:DUF418 domain-containing protein [Corynebacterium comes]QGU04781.1 hypothetical protein CETAM_07635 [Corynebacterium comes]
MTSVLASRTHSAQSSRYIAPDVARGLALLGIALANIPTAWAFAQNADYASDFGGVYGTGTWLENLAVVFHTMFVHVRGLPMFTTLLGFGVGLITLSLWRRGFPVKKARFMLWRRYLLLGAFGVAHLVLLFFGDIIVQYSLTALILIAMISFRDRTLMIIACVLLGLTIAYSMVMSVVALYFPEFMVMDGSIIGLGATESYLEYVATNGMFLGVTLAGMPMTAVALLSVMIIGFVWARQGVLADVASHLTLLRAWVAVAGVVVLLVGLPWGLAAIGVLPPAWELPLSLLNTGVGMLTGPGILALIALIFRGTEEQITPATRAFVALGRRSMSGYILQSVLFLLITQPFTLNWGPTAGILGQMGIALVVWFITLMWALAWDLLDWPGPVEWAHRRLAYGREGLPATYRPKQLSA